MDPNLNHRHVQIHSAELLARAELHRLAGRARASERRARRASTSRLRLGLTDAIRATFARLSTVDRGAPALGSKTRRA
ncbi:MAG TPA: hypothetical protein VGJ61_05360 [Solirubrobacterales bacterium]|jgi:hypothetical protein